MLLVKGITKSYSKKRLTIPVLKGVNFSVGKGEFVSIVGQSGSGKSTLLHLLGTLDSPDSGEVYFGGERIDSLPSVKGDLFRNRSIGFIFQFYHLLPELTALENVLSPLMIRAGLVEYWLKRRQFHENARLLLEQVGLSHRLKHKPNELSGGEMQRTAIARALIAGPQLLLADEPTGNLDAASAKEVIQLLRQLCTLHKLTVIMVTHDHDIAAIADRTVQMVDGVIVPSPTVPVLQRRKALGLVNGVDSAIINTLTSLGVRVWLKVKKAKRKRKRSSWSAQKQENITTQSEKSRAEKNYN